MFITRLRRKTQLRRRKGLRETSRDDATRFKDIVISKTKERGEEVPARLLRELQIASEQQDGGQRLYKLDLRRCNLADHHVEALTDALLELPVLRKLDLRGNEAITARALSSLNQLLKVQVELFRLLQVDASIADSSMSFLYSVKLDMPVLERSREKADELDAHTAALEVADSVLDVRHAFFQADIRETGTLTEHELSGAMRSVMGVMPKQDETARILRFFGETNTEGKDPNLINLDGFEAAMVNRLREAHTLPLLPRRRDDLLFGPTEVGDDQEASEFISPWSTRSFRATADGIVERFEHERRSSSFAHHDIPGKRQEKTHALSPWRGRWEKPQLGDTTKKRDIGSRDAVNEIPNRFRGSRANLGEGTCDAEVNDVTGIIDCSHEAKTSSPPDAGELCRDGSRTPVGGGRIICQTTEALEEGTMAHTHRETGAITFKREDVVKGVTRKVGRSGSLAFAITGASTIPTGRRDELSNCELEDVQPRLQQDNRQDIVHAGDSAMQSRFRPIGLVGSRDQVEGCFGMDMNLLLHEGEDKHVTIGRDCAKSNINGAYCKRDSPTTVHGVEEVTAANGEGNVVANEGGGSSGSLGQVLKGRSRSVSPRSSNRDQAACAVPSVAFLRAELCSTSIPPGRSQKMHNLDSGKDERGISPRERTHSKMEQNYVVSRCRSQTQTPPPSNLDERTDIKLETSSSGTSALEKANIESSIKEAGAASAREGGNASEASSSSCGKGGEEGKFVASNGHTNPSVWSIDKVLVELEKETEAACMSGMTSTEVITAAAPMFVRGMKRGIKSASLGQAEDSYDSLQLATSENRILSEMVASHITGALPSAYDTNLSAKGHGEEGVEERGTIFGGTTCRPVSSEAEIRPTLTQTIAATKTSKESNQEDTVVDHQDGRKSVVTTVPTIELQSPLHIFAKDSSADAGTSAIAESVSARVIVASSSPLDKRGPDTTMRMPHCLSPANVFAATRSMASSCEKKRLLAALTKQSVKSDASFSIEAETGGGGTLLSSSPVSIGPGASNAPQNTASYYIDPPEITSQPWPSVSPKLERRLRQKDEQEEPSSSCRCKTHPICDVRGSTISHKELDLNAINVRRGAGGTCSCLRDSAYCWRGVSNQRGGASEADAGKKGCAPSANTAPPDEKTLAVYFDEGSLKMSRNGLTDMGITLELEATHGLSLGILTGLHTLILSSNQLQVLDLAVLVAMPALRHLDVSNNLLRRMEPAEGRDLPSRLETLIMSHNNISRIGGIGRCCVLRAIDLSFNRIQCVLGLEHLSLLEQLDLGYNLISKTASARALSFNRCLKLLRLEGNPVAKRPRYRSALICLLPHVLAVDRRSMPPSSNVERRGPSGHVCRDTAARAGSAGGRQESAVSRDCQAGQDERRSKEWHQVIKWREQQALREKEKGWKIIGVREYRQGVDAAHQQRLVEELARPRPRTCASEESVSKAKAVVRYRPAVVFGNSYRRDEGSGNARPSTRSGKTKPTKRVKSKPKQDFDAPTAKLSGLRDGHNDDSDDGDRGDHTAGLTKSVHPATVQRSGAHTERVNGSGNIEIRQSAELLAARSEGVSSGKDWDGGLSGARKVSFTARGSDPDNAAAIVDTVKNSDDCLLQNRSPPHLLQMVVDGLVEQQEIVSSQPTSAVVGSSDFVGIQLSAGSKGPSEVAADTTRTFSEEAQKLRGEKVAKESGSSALEAGLVFEWLRDVRLETETAGTALQVLLKMCKGRRYKSNGAQQRLARFRSALEEMGLLSESCPAPMVAASEGACAEEVMAAKRRITITKAAVKNMLHLLEEGKSDKGEGRDQERIDQYAEFIQQQDEIVGVIGGSTVRNKDDRSFVHRSSHEGKNSNLMRDNGAKATKCAPSGSFAAIATPQTPSHGCFTNESCAFPERNAVGVALPLSNSDHSSGGGGDGMGGKIAADSETHGFEEASDGVDSIRNTVRSFSAPARVIGVLKGEDNRIREAVINVRGECDGSIVEIQVTGSARRYPPRPGAATETGSADVPPQAESKPCTSSRYIPESADSSNVEEQMFVIGNTARERCLSTCEIVDENKDAIGTTEHGGTSSSAHFCNAKVMSTTNERPLRADISEEGSIESESKDGAISVRRAGTAEGRLHNHPGGITQISLGEAGRGLCDVGSLSSTSASNSPIGSCFASGENESATLTSTCIVAPITISEAETTTKMPRDLRDIVTVAGQVSVNADAVDVRDHRGSGSNEGIYRNPRHSQSGTTTGGVGSDYNAKVGITLSAAGEASASALTSEATQLVDYARTTIAPPRDGHASTSNRVTKAVSNRSDSPSGAQLSPQGSLFLCVRQTRSPSAIDIEPSRDNADDANDGVAEGCENVIQYEHTTRQESGEDDGDGLDGTFNDGGEAAVLAIRDDEQPVIDDASGTDVVPGDDRVSQALNHFECEPGYLKEIDVEVHKKDAEFGEGEGKRNYTTAGKLPYVTAPTEGGYFSVGFEDVVHQGNKDGITLTSLYPETTEINKCDNIPGALVDPDHNQSEGAYGSGGDESTGKCPIRVEKPREGKHSVPDTTMTSVSIEHKESETITRRTSPKACILEELDSDSPISGRCEEHRISHCSTGEGRTEGEKCGRNSNQSRIEKVDAELLWVEGYDTTHDCYYYYHVPTGESTWQKPDERYERYVHSDEDIQVMIPRVGDRATDARSTSLRGEERFVKRSREEKEETEETKTPYSKDSGGRGGSRSHRRRREEEYRTKTTSTEPSSLGRKKSARRASPRESDCASCSSSHSRSDSTESRLSRDQHRGEKAKGIRRRASEGRLTSSASCRDIVPDRDRSRRSRDRGGKTALERLNDLTDETIDVFGGFSSSGKSEQGGGGRRQNRSPRYRKDKHSRDSARRRRGSGSDEIRHRKEGSGSLLSRKHHRRNSESHDSNCTRRYSSLSHREHNKSTPVLAGTGDAGQAFRRTCVDDEAGERHSKRR